ncbi:DUF4376 domain-containing protein [Solidesulfovibrio magneticus]|uniref:DUF4376 domain-containing protein n=1 Tax=Solidesulfovibrio magneticus (strain ATCC 700980 / DSM 13731 / RS-1) TaxID=573370 RepID=C4XHQ5_SOLM1|nr:DUF4376 domain-containing protein [Solidesulfovibrio magneticus]BAH76429.1 hypothetical protein DMR_29380 [Solidesulfovibrio magneticus RS-1]
MRIFINNGSTIRSSEGADIPVDAQNGQYQQFLALEAAGEAVLVDDAGSTLEEIKTARMAKVTALRDQIRARGVAFGAARLAAMPEDQGTYGDSITYLSWKPEGTRIKWKAATGWIEVDLATLRTAAEVVGDFIEALFDAEHAHHVAINALTSVEAVRAYDITTGWPE